MHAKVEKIDNKPEIFVTLTSKLLSSLLLFKAVLAVSVKTINFTNAMGIFLMSTDIDDEFISYLSFL